MPVPAVSLEQARAHAASRQGLAASGLGSLGEATLGSGCMYGTAPTCYLGYSARVERFVVADLDRELYERRSLVRLRAMRGSSYTVPVDLLGVVVGATEDIAGGVALERILRYIGVDFATYADVSARIEELMAGQGPMTKGQIKSELGSEVPVRGDALNYVIAVMARECRVVRATVRGGWRSDSYSYALWQDWLGEPLERVEVEAARAALARVYLHAYGPATLEDLRWWAGWKPPQARAAVAALGDELVEVDLDGAAALVLAAEFDALVGVDVAAGRGARLRPVWDAWLMGWQDRRRLVSDDRRPLIYDKAGNGTSVLLVDGCAAGVSELRVSKRDALTIQVAPFTRVRWKDVEAAAERIATSVSASSLDLERAETRPKPLSASSARNAFLSPIRLGA
jgi:DNA glycosylase AlkZ-like